MSSTTSPRRFVVFPRAPAETECKPILLARILPRQLVQVCGNAPGSQILLHPRCDERQVLVPAAGFPRGRPQQHACDLETGKLHVHLPWSLDTEFVQRQLCFVVVEVRFFYQVFVVLTGIIKTVEANGYRAHDIVKIDILTNHVVCVSQTTAHRRI